MSIKRGDFRELFATLNIDVTILNLATEIYREQMTIPMPRFLLNQKQLALVCLNKAVKIKGENLLPAYIGRLLGLTPKQIESGFNRYTDLQTGYKAPQVVEKVHDVPHYLNLAARRMHMKDGEITVLIEHWSVNADYFKKLDDANHEKAGAFLMYFLDQRGHTVDPGEFSEVIQVTNLNKVTRIKDRFVRFLNN
jgi:hypothetical protein